MQISNQHNIKISIYTRTVASHHDLNEYIVGYARTATTGNTTYVNRASSHVLDKLMIPNGILPVHRVLTPHLQHKQKPVLAFLEYLLQHGRAVNTKVTACKRFADVYMHFVGRISPNCKASNMWRSVRYDDHV